MPKELTQKVSIRIQRSLRQDLKTLGQADKRDEADYWRKVLSDHRDEARRTGKLAAAAEAVEAADVTVEEVES